MDFHFLYQTLTLTLFLSLSLSIYFYDRRFFLMHFLNVVSLMFFFLRILKYYKKVQSFFLRINISQKISLFFAIFLVRLSLHFIWLWNFPIWSPFPQPVKTLKPEIIFISLQSFCVIFRSLKETSLNNNLFTRNKSKKK